MSHYDFVYGLKCLQYSSPNKVNNTLSIPQKKYLRKIRQGIYQKLLEDNLHCLTEENINSFRESLRSEDINFLDIIESISCSSKVSIPTTINNLELSKKESYQIKVPHGLKGYMIKDKVKEELQKRVSGNWWVGEIETLQGGKNFKVKMLHQCMVSIPLNISVKN